MSLACPTMLDYSRLNVPPHHGDVLVQPRAADWASAIRENAKRLRNASTPLAGATLAEWRRQTRAKIVGDEDRLVIVTGHQPEFIHPGVWAKHITAVRAAEALEAVAVDLVVDSDAVKRTALPVPVLSSEGVALSAVRFTDCSADLAYEQLPPKSPAEMAAWEKRIRETMGDRYAISQMPTFFEAVREVRSPHSWADQTVAGRKAIERRYGVVVEDRRISRYWCTPLVVDMLLHAPRFAQSYNRALATYRKENRLRSRQRPMPDLARQDDRWETALWTFRASEPRHRLFVARRGDGVSLFAGSTKITEITTGELACCQSLEDSLDGWQLRPRALALTMWARLLLADLFIHGIGGAKYDRISDRIIADYYGLVPPRIACVSATLHMGLPHSGVTGDTVRRFRRALRDLRYNPQRQLKGKDKGNALIERRTRAVQQSQELADASPHDHQARRAAFDEIRAASAALLKSTGNELKLREEELTTAQQQIQRNRIAMGREYFFGLYDGKRLGRLADALPAKGDFTVYSP